MITKMTPEQEAKVPVYLKKWLEFGHRTKSIDKEKATEAVHFYYKEVMKRDAPKHIIFLDSPMACQIALNLFNNPPDSQLYSQLDSQLDSQLGSQLDSQLRSQLDSRLDSRLYSQLYSQLDSQLRSQLYSQLDSQLRSQLDSQLDDEPLKHFDHCYPANLWNWGGYYAFYEFILMELMPEKTEDFGLFHKLLKHYQELHYSWMMPDLCILSDFPQKFNLDEQGRLHSFDEPALLYRDTYAVHSISGLRVPEYITKTPRAEFTKEMILKEENVDNRRCIIQKIGIDKAIEVLGAEVMDTRESEIGGRYELLSIDYDGRGNKRPYLKMNSKSIGAAHIEGCGPNVKTVEAAICFRNKLRKFVEPQFLS